MSELQEQLRGRLLTARELKTSQENLEKVKGMTIYPAIEKRGGSWYCQRCQNQDQALFYPNFCNCGQSCVYCLSCLEFGKVRTCDYLYHLPMEGRGLWARDAPYLAWDGQLSRQQAEAAEAICASYEKKENHLVTAVTGAGKTEMIFPLIDLALRNGDHIGLATPRIDVANELYPRIREAFPEIEVLLLHSASEMTYHETPVIISSTHQLLRFESYFDLLIIDEIDAFPFDQDPMLHRAAKRALKPSGVFTWLTATPSPTLEREVEEGQLSASSLPARYHRHALPVPETRWVGDWRGKIRSSEIPPALLQIMDQEFDNNRRFLLFLPHIQLMLKLEKNLKSYYPEKRLASVSSKDPDRTEKVMKMREKQYDCLLTTTILERGVTFEDIDVVVLGTEDRTFTKSSLVQISGRVGRKPSAPTGRVVFLHEGITKACKEAIQQIERENEEARKRGLIDD